MTEQDKQALIEYYCQRDCGHTREECCLDNCHEIMLIEEFPITPTDIDTISRQAAIDICDNVIDVFRGQFGAGVLVAIKESIEELPSAQPQRTCVNCGRTVNNGGWYADGGTRCPIEEHYALPKDGFCHLWEKRNVTDDDYHFCRDGERREDG